MRNKLTLDDWREPYLVVFCESCGRRGRYAVTRLKGRFGDMGLPELKNELTQCPKARAMNFYDPCRARFERPSR